MRVITRIKGVHHIIFLFVGLELLPLFEVLTVTRYHFIYFFPFLSPLMELHILLFC